jgi:hypothetical protein
MTVDVSSSVCPGCNGTKLPGLHFCAACRRLLPEHMKPGPSSGLKVYASAIRCIKTRRRPITSHETKRNHSQRFDERWNAGAVKRST